MTRPEQPSRLPRIELAVRRTGGRYRKIVDLTTPDAPADDIPGVGRGQRVRIDVADGLTVAELPMAAALAQQVRGADVVELIGRTRRAVEDARTVFENAWRLDVDPAAPRRPEQASAARWAALMLGTTRQEGPGR